MNIFVFTGHMGLCSSGQLLLFNEEEKILSIIEKKSMELNSKYKCKDDLENLLD